MNESAPTSVLPRRDFPDWLSPMLVKELRQGMRTRVFVSCFILLQVLMTLVVVIGLLGSAEDFDARIATAIFWAMVAIPLLFVLPLSGLNALSGEKAANTLELIFLTRLSAWRIVAGKWCAIIAQIALFTCAILPYAVLRYFMGGVNLSDNLVTLAVILAASAVLAAASVGLSPYQTKVTRVFTVLGLIFCLQFFLPFLLLLTFGGSMMRSAGMPIPTIGWEIVAGALVFGVLFIALMLQIGAARIAPAAENHSAIKRLLGLAFLVLAVVLAALGVPAALPGLVAMACCAPVIIGAVVEPVATNQAVYRPFARRGLSGRLAGRLLYPGWPAGVLYVLVLFASFAVFFAAHGLLASTEAQFAFVSAAGAVLFPVVVLRLFFSRTQNPIGFFSGIVAVCALLAVIASVLDSLFDLGLREGVCLLPPAAFLQSVFGSVGSEFKHVALPLCTISTALSACALVALMIPQWRRIHELERAAQVDERVA